MEQRNPLVLPHRREEYLKSRYAAFDITFWILFLAAAALAVAAFLERVSATAAFAAVLLALGVFKLGEYAHTSARELGLKQGRSDLELLQQWLDQSSRELDGRLSALEARLGTLERQALKAQK